MNYLENNIWNENMKFISGLGWLVPVLFFAIYYAVRYIVISLFSLEYFFAQLWPKIAIAVLFALCSWLLAYRKNVRSKVLVIDADTGETIGRAPAKHQFLFIPMQYWGLLLIVALIMSVIFDWWNACELMILCK